MCINELEKNEQKSFWEEYDELNSQYHKLIFSIRSEAYAKMCKGILDIEEIQKAIEKASLYYRKEFVKLCQKYQLNPENWLMQV